ncbi:hypothetical protein L1987_60128 [Smallanthus sonchifolius]|uniref:Uncharacterized protein n=1 Tax=Smallanthus sonchifolius TaxID=185202 RepID=A0ACB9D7K4_9ASTR|nr:hypothetical protein L1987_60128 [Smallanthus sonchifolius]
MMKLCRTPRGGYEQTKPPYWDGLKNARSIISCCQCLRCQAQIIKHESDSELGKLSALKLNDKDNSGKRLQLHEVSNEVYTQFLAGIQTIVIIPVHPHGVVHLGSSSTVMENTGFC